MSGGGSSSSSSSRGGGRSSCVSGRGRRRLGLPLTGQWATLRLRPDALGKPTLGLFFCRHSTARMAPETGTTATTSSSCSCCIVLSISLISCFICFPAAHPLPTLPLCSSPSGRPAPLPPDVEHALMPHRSLNSFVIPPRPHHFRRTDCYLFHPALPSKSSTLFRRTFAPSIASSWLRFSTT